MITKSPFIIFILSFFIINIANAFTKFELPIKIANKNNVICTDKIVEIAWSKIDQNKRRIDTSRLIVVDAITKKQVAFQYEKKKGQT